MIDLKKAFAISTALHLMGLTLFFALLPQQDVIRRSERERFFLIDIVAERLAENNHHKELPVLKAAIPVKKRAAKKEPSPVLEPVQKATPPLIEEAEVPENKVVEEQLLAQVNELPDSNITEDAVPPDEIEEFAPENIAALSSGGIDATPSPNTDIIDIILAKIEKAKVYPRLARKRGVEGTATVRFKIEPDGRVKEVKLIKSSGYSILDNASIKTIQKAQPFPHVDFVLKLAVSFRLT